MKETPAASVLGMRVCICDKRDTYDIDPFSIETAGRPSCSSGDYPSSQICTTTDGRLVAVEPLKDHLTLKTLSQNAFLYILAMTDAGGRLILIIQIEAWFICGRPDSIPNI